VIIRGCVIKNVYYYGVAMNATGAGAARFGEVTDNYLENIPRFAAIIPSDNYYARIDGNTIVNAWRGVQTNNHSLAIPAGKAASISNNTITSAIQEIAGAPVPTRRNYDGILHNLQSGPSSWTIAGNTVTNLSTLNDDANSDGIEIWSIQTGATVTVSDNVIVAFPRGYTLWNCPTIDGVTVSGGSVSGAAYGVYATNRRGSAGNANSSSYTVSNVAISNSTNGVFVVDSPLNTNSAKIGRAHV